MARARNYRNISSYITTDGKQTSHNLQFPDFFLTKGYSSKSQLFNDLSLVNWLEQLNFGDRR